MPFRFLIGPTSADGNTLADAEATAPAWVEGAELRLSPDRSNYLCKVLRKRRNDTIDCFDGAGTQLLASVTEPSPKRACLKILNITERVAPPAHHTHIVLGMLKGAAMDRAVQQATELGASDISLVTTARSNVKLDSSRMSNKLEHWRRVAQAACEQCGQLYVPRLQAGGRLGDVLEAVDPNHCIVLQADAVAMPRQLTAQDWHLFVGPEGGWDEVELSRFAQLGITAHSIGPFTLRAETVPSVALAMLYAATSAAVVG